MTRGYLLAWPPFRITLGHRAWVRGFLQVTMWADHTLEPEPRSPELTGRQRTGHPSPGGLQHLWEKAPGWPGGEDEEDGVDAAEGSKVPSSGLQCPGQDAPQGGRYLVHAPDIQSQSILQHPHPGGAPGSASHASVTSTPPTLPGRTMTVTQYCQLSLTRGHQPRKQLLQHKEDFHPQDVASPSVPKCWARLRTAASGHLCSKGQGSAQKQQPQKGLRAAEPLSQSAPRTSERLRGNKLAASTPSHRA